ncbi:gliding motility-associated C-terminal domain-containing protein [Spongiimicrobium sp. 3-5]|uniref:gliding motility-associated C-terminal domain-containing protein n=1 Tax=Spongiimicrobium sp. 3-5 TaxID=3332596 RepID=UPI0039810D0A
MKKLVIFILALSFTASMLSQDAVHNYGTIQFHDDTQVGFHIDLINDGTFDQNLGLVGFYSADAPLTVSGAFSPVFLDAEIAVENGLFLEVSMGISNNTNFISGNIGTSKTQSDAYLNFLDESFYVGENQISKVDGYAGISNKESFTFPIGTTDRLRPLSIQSSAVNALAKCAYYDEDPDTTDYFGGQFSTDAKDSELLSVSREEFWRLEGDMPSTVTLTWDMQSNINDLAELISDLKVVGWSKTTNQWVNLGSTNVEGGLTNGAVTSDLFVPNDYEILTIGGNDEVLETLNTIELDNYFLTPNGDGNNDYLVIDGIEKSPSNNLQIFDRYGIMVYSKVNYTDEFDGRSNRNGVIKKGKALASGIYFYIITLNDLKIKHQGYMYISE